MPFLSLPATRPARAADAAGKSDDDDSDEEPPALAPQPNRKKGAGKDKKSKGSKGGPGGKKGRAEPDDEVPPSDEAAPATTSDEGLTVMDVLWPKKESLTLVKW